MILSCECDTIRIATKNEDKQTRHHRNIKRSLLINATLNKQIRDIGFGSLYCPLCFDYGIYSEMIMNLRMIDAMHLIFNNMSLPYSYPLANFSHTPVLRSQAL